MDDQASTLASLPSTPDRYTNLNRCIEQAFGDPKYADFEIHCGGRVWHVHRLIICGQCPFFDKACSGHFLESKSKTIHLEEDNPYVVQEMLHCFYTGDYHVPENSGELQGDIDPLLMDVLVHSNSDKYDIPELSQLACRKFSIRVAEQWSSAGFAKAIEELYTGPDRNKEEMRSKVVATANKHAKELFKMESAIEFRNVAKSVPRFAADLCVDIVQNKQTDTDIRWYRCPSCTRTVIVMASNLAIYGAWDCNFCCRHHNSLVWEKYRFLVPE